MTSAELKWFHKKLLETKDAENKAHEDAVRSAKNAAKSAQATANAKRGFKGNRRRRR